MHNCFNDFLGNESAKKTLTSFFRDRRFPHAVLFYGEKGCGKTTLAYLLAEAMVCTAPQGEEVPCGNCAGCLKAQKRIHPDIILLEGSGAARSFHIREIRELKEDAFVKPNEAEYKIYILKNCESMTVQAQNALLKILEEPPHNVAFLLTCENRGMLLETILSRVVPVPVLPVSSQECLRYLTESDPGRDPSFVAQAAELSGGVIGKALTLLDDPDFPQYYQDFLQAARLILNGDEYSLSVTLTRLSKDKQKFRQLLKDWSALLHQVLLYKLSGDDVVSNRDDVVVSLGALTTSDQVYGKIELLNQCLEKIDGNANMSLLVAWLCAMLKAVSEV